MHTCVTVKNYLYSLTHILLAHVSVLWLLSFVVEDLRNLKKNSHIPNLNTRHKYTVRAW